MAIHHVAAPDFSISGVASLADLPRLQEVKWLMQTYLRRTWLSAAALQADYMAERK